MSPAEVGLVEAHGTGTPTGDRIELGTTTEVFTEAGAAPGSVVIGSVKSNIAGTSSAPPGSPRSSRRPGPCTTASSRPPCTSASPTRCGTRPPARSCSSTGPARGSTSAVAAVSGFGFGGTNFHAVLENDRPPDGADPPVGRHHWPAELVALRAEDGPGLDIRLAALAGRADAALDGLHQADRWRLRTWPPPSRRSATGRCSWPSSPATCPTLRTSWRPPGGRNRPGVCRPRPPGPGPGRRWRS